MGHIDDRGVRRFPDPMQLALEDQARLRIEGSQWLVHQQQMWHGRQCPCDGDALAHATRQFVRKGVLELIEAHKAQVIVDAGEPLSARQ